MKSVALAVLMVAVFSGCSGNAPRETGGPKAPTGVEEKPAAKANEALTGRAAFQQTYVSARGWARDAQPYLEESQPTQDSTGADGKSSVWRAGFGSASRGLAKSYTWSGSNASDAPSRGVQGNVEDTFSAGNSSTRTFDLGFLKMDSNNAIEVAQKHGGKKLLDKTPSMPIYYRLHWDAGNNALVWNVMYGGSGNASKLNVLVDASTGQFIRIQK